MPALMAGAAKAAITPRENLRLAGYSPTDKAWLMPFRHRVATGVHDDIFARCLVLSAGEHTLALVALDLIGFFNEDIEKVRARAREKTGREDLEIVVASTHNHSAPDTYGFYGGVPASYKALVHDQASGAIATAVNNLTPARIGFATTHVEGVHGNNRNPETGPVDGEMAAMLVENAEGETIAVLVNFGCHNDILGKKNSQVSADFAGYTCRELERARGGVGIFFNGALGDQYPLQSLNDPEDEKGLRTFEQAEALGKKVAETVLAALPKEGLKSDVTISVERAVIDLPITNRVVTVMRLLRVLKRKIYNGHARTESWNIGIDGAQIVTVPGQAFCRLGQELKADMEGEHKFLFGLANDEIIYIVPPDEWDPARKSEEEMGTLGRGTWPALREAMPLKRRST